MERTEPATRAIDIRIEIDAPPDVVWQALTEAEQLESWFPLNARVKPGAGGSVWASWGGASTYEARIEIWEPARHLRLIDHDADPAMGMTVPLAQDYHIEGKAGGTVLRFVHSGFSPDTDWDEMFDTMSSGWRYFFFSLKHYVEKHAGVHRAMVWTRRPVTDRPRDEGWRHVLRGFGLDPAARERDAFTLTLGGEQLSGTVVQKNAPVHFAGTLPDLNDGLFLVELEPGQEKWHVGFWLSTYSVDPTRVQRLQRDLDASMDRLLGSTENA